MVVHHDDVLDKLLLPQGDNDDADGMTIELLQLLFQAFYICTKRLLADHLPGGKFHSLLEDEQMVFETKSVPTTNVTPERNFAMLDRLLREKPNANMIALEALILYSNNQSPMWLEKMSTKDKDRLFTAARSLAPIIRSKFKKRQEEMQTKRLNNLLKKENELAKKQRQAMIEKENLTKEISKVGLWSTPVEVETGLDCLTTKTAKVKALKLQLQFRQKVISQVHIDTSVFKFSQNGKPHPITKLKENLCKLLEPPPNPDTQQNTDDVTLQCSSLEQVRANPMCLVGHKINHRFEDESGGQQTWYEGTVLNYNSETQLFTVVYTEDEEHLNFNLIEDIDNGDLLIIDK